MSQSHRIAFIGCGKRAKSHVPGVQADERCEVVALTDVDPDAGESLNSEASFGATVYTEHTEMLSREKPNVVITCLWTPLHLPIFRDCVEAGVKAVLSEKPMAPTWGESLEMGRLADESGCQLTFCHQRRFRKGNLAARRLIEEGRFGKVQRMDLYSPPNLLDCGTHTFDQALSFNKETPAKWAMGAVDASEPIKWFDVSAEAMATGLVVFENGVRAYLQTGGPDVDMRSGVRVLGSEGFIEVQWDGQWSRAVVYDEPGWQPPAIEGADDDPMIDVVRNALDCLESGDEPLLSHHHALRAAEIIFALYESVRRHARIELPLDTVDNPFLTMLDAGAFGSRTDADDR